MTSGHLIHRRLLPRWHHVLGFGHRQVAPFSSFKVGLNPKDVWDAITAGHTSLRIYVTCVLQYVKFDPETVHYGLKAAKCAAENPRQPAR